jgi:hypothetical protein
LAAGLRLRPKSAAKEEPVADLTALKEAGMDIDSLPSEQQEAIGKLDQSEIDTLASIRRKLDDNMPDVSGYAVNPRADGNFVW